MNQSVTYCPTVQSLTLVKLLIPFDIFKKKKKYDLFPDLKSDLNDLIMKYLMLSGQVDDIPVVENLQNQQLAKPGLHTLGAGPCREGADLLSTARLGPWPVLSWRPRDHSRWTD